MIPLRDGIRKLAVCSGIGWLYNSEVLRVSVLLPSRSWYSAAINPSIVRLMLTISDYYEYGL
jgi:hypothetical protein